MLVTVNKTCHVPRTFQITTSETNVTKILSRFSKERVRFWSHASSVTDLKTFVKKLSVVRPKALRKKRKRKKKERLLQSFLRYAHINRE